MKKHKVSNYSNMGTSIGLGATVVIVPDALLQNLILCLCAGSGVGAVIGAKSMLYKRKTS